MKEIDNNDAYEKLVDVKYHLRQIVEYMHGFSAERMVCGHANPDCGSSTPKDSYFSSGLLYKLNEKITQEYLLIQDSIVYLQAPLAFMGVEYSHEEYVLEDVTSSEHILRNVNTVTSSMDFLIRLMAMYINAFDRNNIAPFDYGDSLETPMFNDKIKEYTTLLNSQINYFNDLIKYFVDLFGILLKEKEHEVCTLKAAR